MTERERLETQLKDIDAVIDELGQSLHKYIERRYQVWMKLNRARRLEREELQDAERKS